MKKFTVKWACPKCRATPGHHGKGGQEQCKYFGDVTLCDGFLCGCEDEETDTPEHGRSAATPCPNAYCMHCGWEGEFPTKQLTAEVTKNWPTWAKTALAAGWTPPANWKPPTIATAKKRAVLKMSSVSKQGTRRGARKT